MFLPLTRTQQKFLFLLGISLLYLILVVWLDFLKGPYWHDEIIFWETSVSFSDQLLFRIDDLRDYKELNTPLPFIVFGAVEYLFGQGIAAGRLLNLMLSLAMVFLIGWPTQSKGNRAILCLIGLFLCPYFLWLSGRLYTEMIACFWVLMGLIGYVRQRYLWSGVAFVLAIASRQYMLAFPAAIATYEFIVALVNVRQTSAINWREQWRWIAPALAACSILGWFYLFQGLAPASAYESRPAPAVQTTLWAMEPGGAIHYLAFMGLYIVIPEFLLFDPRSRLRSWRAQWGQEKYRVGIIALGLLLFMLVFPPPEFASGNVVKLADLLSHSALRWGLYYLLALLACVRFAKPNLMAFLIFVNAAIMVKAHPWDRYALPMVVAFWYLRSLDVADQFSIPWRSLSLKRRSKDLSSPKSI